MYVAYFFNSSGRYQRKIYLNTVYESLELVFRFKSIVPKIMVTQDDMSAMESVGGEIVHPDIDGETLKTLENKYPPIKFVPLDLALDNYRENVKKLRQSDTVTEELTKILLHSEYYLLAVAAGDGVNLSCKEYIPSDDLIAELNAEAHL